MAPSSRAREDIQTPLPARVSLAALAREAAGFWSRAREARRHERARRTSGWTRLGSHPSLSGRLQASLARAIVAHLRSRWWSTPVNSLQRPSWGRVFTARTSGGALLAVSTPYAWRAASGQPRTVQEAIGPFFVSPFFRFSSFNILCYELPSIVKLSPRKDNE